jgi:probable phosphoglycerate mutase
VSAQAGGADPELSPQGHTQAEALGAWAADLTGEKVVEVVVSGMRRAQQTAAPAAGALGLDPVVDPDLAEFDVGRPSYQPVHARLGSDDPDWQRITEGYLPDFVDAEAFTARVRGAFGRIIGRHRPLTFPLDHAGLSRVLVSRGGRVRVRSVNETGHVAGAL